MNVSVKKRKELYDFFKKKLKESEPFVFLNKKNVLGKGGQGKVYRYCLSKPSKYCMAVKKMYLDNKESKHLKDIYSDNAYKQSVYIELSSMQLVNELILQNVCPNYILNYDFMYKDRDGICDDIYPHTMYYFNEFIDGAEIYTDWVKKNHTIKEWYNAYFQITVAVYALQRHFNMTHLDLHSDNIIVIKIKEGGHWVYEIDGERYYVPNCGYVFYINDFGHAWIPKEFRSWFIRQRYNKKRINKSFDIMTLFRSTFKFSTSPQGFKKHIKNVIKELSGDKLFTHTISEIWSDYKEKISKSKLIDKYNLDKNLSVKNLHPKLKKLVIMK
jgi:hypothetical protein